ncbi:MAG: hypothetical protein H6567_07240 [Lewinellaceae bacterium]|nr:hypothetical protein [Lewinellaceae bacterium]
MTLKQLIKIEDKAKEVWVVSPNLHYDTENAMFSELVSVNRNEKTKYRYIVPATKQVVKNMELYKKMFSLTDDEMNKNFLVLPDTSYTPFIMEVGIYDANTKCAAYAAPALEGGDEVIQFDSKTSETFAKEFKALWKTFKREKL